MTRINELNEAAQIKTSDKIALYDVDESLIGFASIDQLSDKMREDLGIDELSAEVAPTSEALIYNGSGEIYFAQQDILSAADVLMQFNGGTVEYYQPGFNESFKFDYSNTNFIEIYIDLSVNQAGVLATETFTLRRVGGANIMHYPFTPAYLKTHSMYSGMIPVEAFDRFEIVVNTGAATDRARIYEANAANTGRSRIRIDSYQQDFDNV